MALEREEPMKQRHTWHSGENDDSIRCLLRCASGSFRKRRTERKEPKKTSRTKTKVVVITTCSNYQTSQTRSYASIHPFCGVWCFLWFGRRRSFDCIDRKPAYPGIKCILCTRNHVTTTTAQCSVVTSCVASNRVESSLALTTMNTFFQCIDDSLVHDPPLLFLMIPFAKINTKTRHYIIYHLNFLTLMIHFFFFRFLRNQIIIINTKWIGYEYHYHSPLHFFYTYIYILYL